MHEICRERDVLFVADEVITGFGRCGRWFASERFGLDPDLLTCAKGITSGYLPLGRADRLAAGRRAVLPARRDVAARLHVLGSRGSLRGGACEPRRHRARRASSRRADELERELADALAPLAEHPRVREVRAGTGVLAAVALAADDAALPARTMAELRRRGVLTRLLADGALQISPSLVSTRADFDALAEAIADSLA